MIPDDNDAPQASPAAIIAAQVGPGKRYRSAVECYGAQQGNGNYPSAPVLTLPDDALPNQPDRISFTLGAD